MNTNPKSEIPACAASAPASTNVLTGVAGPWTPVPPPCQTNSGVISVTFTNAPPVGNQFFRLRKP